MPCRGVDRFMIVETMAAKCSLQMQILQKCEAMLEKRLAQVKELNEIQTGKRI